MSDVPGQWLEEEPQAVRGPKGSRDTGSDEPAGGPADRPAGTADDDPNADTSVKQSEPAHRGAPDLQSGG
ncbi:MAG: hypothetical protein QOE03_2879 [Micromonosporaceae bacterium]|jgi:hypothetical protein|nr:hypothetical protein [Micromonosporaceae bacterium]